MNEFIVRNGLISLDSSQITGSLSITGSLTVNTSGVELQVTNTGVNIGNISTDVHNVTGSLLISGSTRLIGNATITGSLGVSGGITGSLLGTASYAAQALSSSFATTASYVLNAVSASFATSASRAQSAATASFVLNAVSASFAISSSYALTASYVEGGLGTPIYTHTQSSSSSAWSITHSLGTLFPIVTVYDSSNNVIIPQEITSLTTSSLSITFPLSITGYASIAGGSFSSITQGITQNESIINSFIFG